MPEMNKDSAFGEYYVCICEQMLLCAYGETSCFSVKYNHTKGKAGAGMWKKK